jgi:periplasmic protein TonB
MLKSLFFIISFLVALKGFSQQNKKDSLVMDNGDTIYCNVEIQASFKGNWGNFLKKNLHYPKVAIKKNVQGKVIIDFIVERNGSIRSLKIAEQSPQKDTILVGECIRVLRLTSGRWKPGYQNGIPVHSYHSQLVIFLLTN